MQHPAPPQKISPSPFAKKMKKKGRAPSHQFLKMYQYYLFSFSSIFTKLDYFFCFKKKVKKDIDQDKLDSALQSLLALGGSLTECEVQPKLFCKISS